MNLSKNICQIAKTYQLDLIQLHGDEPSEYTYQLSKNHSIIKAFGINETFDFSICENYQLSCKYFLFDTASPFYGGTGKKFNHNLLKEYTLPTPFFLSGRIGLEEAQIIKESFSHPAILGIDVNSRFENNETLKITNKIKQLTKIIK